MRKIKTSDFRLFMRYFRGFLMVVPGRIELPTPAFSVHDFNAKKGYIKGLFSIFTIISDNYLTTIRLQPIATYLQPIATKIKTARIYPSGCPN